MILNNDKDSSASDGVGQARRTASGQPREVGWQPYVNLARPGQLTFLTLDHWSVLCINVEY